jgi:UDP-N-acetylmuramyl pentapeptide synthase
MENPVIAITGSVGKSSTRLMLENMLADDHIVVATRGNHNTRMGVALYGAKLARRPDFGILEISLNALNNKGNQSLLLRPTVAMVTSIGEAHLSTLHSKKNITSFKSRIIDGLVDGGIMVVNKDIEEPHFQFLEEKAKKKTSRVVTYSLKDSSATLYLETKTIYKTHTEVQFNYQQRTYRFSMQMASEGMISNALGAILCLGEVGLPLDDILPRLHTFRSLDRVLELKEMTTADGRNVTVLDDSHNASIPAMKNAIQTFDERKKFYKGKKILVLGQIADLGADSQSLHDNLVTDILEAEPDIVFGHGTYMRNVIKALPSHLVAGWFTNAKDLAERIPYYCSNDSLVLLKGSVSGSDFRHTSHLLPRSISKSTERLTDFSPHNIVKQLRPQSGLKVYDVKNNCLVKQQGFPKASNLEGIAHILLCMSVLDSQVDLSKTVTLRDWPTNSGESVGGTAFQRGESFTIGDLVEELLRTQHASAIYQLGYSVFGSVSNALRDIQNYAERLQIHEKAVLNLTGRYRVKEQQSYDLEDLLKVGMEMKRLIQEGKWQQGDHQTSPETFSVSFGRIKRVTIAINQELLQVQIGFENETRKQRVHNHLTVPSEYLVLKGNNV